MSDPTEIRIAKIIARAGVCSRREAERLIGEGRVKIGNSPVKTPAIKVPPDSDIRIDNTRIAPPGPARLWRFNKPRGILTTTADPEGRRTVFDILPPEVPRVISVGRLDMNSEGLLLLSTDGHLARYLEHPDTGWSRRYRVRVHGRPDDDTFAPIRKGCTLEGIRYAPASCHIERQQGSNAWLSITLKEGKNREIRRLMESLDLKVNRLIRVAFGPFQLGNLPAGKTAEVPRGVLKDQLGEKWRSESSPDASAESA